MPWKKTKNDSLLKDALRRSAFDNIRAMADSLQLDPEVIEKYPIGKGLDDFRSSFKSACEAEQIACSPDALDKLEDRDLHALRLCCQLSCCRASRFLPSSGRGARLSDDISGLYQVISSNEFDFRRIKPLLRAVLADDFNDEDIWQGVYKAVTETTPPPRSLASSVEQTPSRRNTGSFPNSSEHRSSMDIVLRGELDPLHVGVPGFFSHFFGGVKNLEPASWAFFRQCTRGKNPLFKGGWEEWPGDANEEGVLRWFAGLSEELAAFAGRYESAPTHRRKLWANPNKHIGGSVAKRKMDFGFVSDPVDGKGTSCDWRQVLFPGEQKSNPDEDKNSQTWLDLGRYAREVFAAQDTRRFVLGFTLCGSLMRIWEFDRGGGTASEEFDINKDGRRFVYVILGFLWMNDEQLGLDPTITKEGELRFITINRKGRTERLVIHGEPIQRARCIAGRATTCWKAYREEDPKKLFVIKDSWQYPEREKEGQMLSEAKKKRVVNVARYYHHETVFVRGKADKILDNVRGGWVGTEARIYRPKQEVLSLNSNAVNTSQKSRSSSATGVKRSISHDDTTLTANKRPRLGSSTKPDSSELPNREHRRVVLSSYGKAIYKASSRSALLTALEGCIEGHRSLYEAGFLHRDISINNLMINEDGDNPTSFLIDLDLAIRRGRGSASQAKGRTGTRAFMAIGVLKGELHSFLHDLESFFWVLFWICIHYNRPGDPSDVKTPVVKSYDSWNFKGVDELAKIKYATVYDEDMFLRAIEEFTEYYKPLAPWVSRLREVVFLDKQRWKTEDKRLYSWMKDILGEARDAMLVLEAGGNTKA